MEISINIRDLEDILRSAQQVKEKDSSLGNTIVLKLLMKTEIHGSSDTISVNLESKYQECNGVALGNVRQLRKFTSKI